ncbi:MAG: DUF2061 domain-containing protein [Proteobacteria bacterium]|jgi:uncharacterized membrane protein|nr:DUF2061 domain-containing protein [Alphaproteobacteria bacterium]NCC03310.1 DUF2061 domain-containing protein [Pseudomonadota bacterium]
MKHLALIKTLSYGTMHMGIAIMVAYILSESWKIAFAIGLIEPCIQTVAYFFHERAWHHLERKRHLADLHNSVIDSISPAPCPLETALNSMMDQKNTESP